MFLAHFPRTLTLANWLGCLYLLGFGLCVFVVLLFPTGKLPSRRWRPVAWATGPAWPGGPWAAPSLHDHLRQPDDAEPGRRGRAGGGPQGSGDGRRGVDRRHRPSRHRCRWRSVRHTGTIERAQLKWLVYAGAVIVVAVLAPIPIASNNLQNAISSGAVALVPVAIGIAVLRYRLYDIDRIISRTAGLRDRHRPAGRGLAGLVLLATQVLGMRPRWRWPPLRWPPRPCSARASASTARGGPAVEPGPVDADQTVAAFAARLKDAVDLDTVRDDLASVVPPGPGTHPRIAADRPTQLSLAAADSAAVKPGPSTGP